MPYEVIWQKSLNPRKYEKPTLPDDLQTKFDKHFATDIAIYEHFKQVLFDKVNAFGHGRMKDEIAKMRRVFQACNKNAKLCHFTRKHTPKPAPRENIKPSLKYYLERAESGFGQCPYPNSAYQIAKHYEETGQLTGCDNHVKFIKTMFEV